jgi:hypothetical protein
VLLAVHHQQVGQREVGVADDVRPDLRQLGLDRRGLHDRRVEGGEQLGHLLAGVLAHAADDARQRVDLLQKAPGGDALGSVGDEHVAPHLEPALLGQVAGHEVGGAGRDRGAQDQGVAGPQHRQQVVQRRADVAHVDLDVGERRRAQRDDDLLGRGGVRHGVGQRQAARLAHALEQRLGARLLERHAPGADRGEAVGVLVYAHDGEPPVGEAQREREPYPSEADDRYVRGHGDGG